MLPVVYMLLIAGATSSTPQWHIPRAQPAPPPVYHPVPPASYPHNALSPSSWEKAREALPKNSPSSWVTLADYPSQAIKNREEGRATVRLEVDKLGEVKDCIVTVSSGSALLDATTCGKIAERARFEPARNVKGKATTGAYSSAVRWALPDMPDSALEIAPN